MPVAVVGGDEQVAAGQGGDGADAGRACVSAAGTLTQRRCPVASNFMNSTRDALRAATASVPR